MSNGVPYAGGIPAGMGGGGYTGYAPLAVPATYGTPTVQPIAGDISALTSPSYEFTFDPLAPLDTTGFVFAPEPTPAVSTVAPLPVIESFYVSTTPRVETGPIETVIPYQSPGLGEVLWEAPGNVVKLAGDLLTSGVDILVDTGKFILEHLEIGTKTIQTIGGVTAQQKAAKAQETQAKAQLTAAQAQLTAAQRPVTPGITDQLANWLSGLTGIPPEATPPFVETGTIGVQAPTNWLLLGGLAVGAYLLLKGR